MDKPIVNPNLNNLIGIFWAIAMMRNKPYPKVVEAAKVDILGIAARENYPYEVCTEHLHALCLIGDDEGIFMPTLQFEGGKIGSTSTISYHLGLPRVKG